MQNVKYLISLKFGNYRVGKLNELMVTGRYDTAVFSLSGSNW